MARPAKFVRVIEQPDGSFRRFENGAGREIHGLRYRRTTRNGFKPERGVDYVLDDQQKQVTLGSDLVKALEQVSESSA